MQNTCRMQKFVQQHGGRVRFDAFAREHLLGETGFYSAYVDMSRYPHRALTPSSKESYAQYVSLYICNLVLKHAQNTMPRGSTVKFGEIGGGGGYFKRAFVGHLEFFKQSGSRYGVEYISIEPNPNHRKAQSFAGKVVEGTAQSTGLPEASLDFVFDDEVLDCMPFRLFNYHDASGKIVEEAFVEWTGEQLKLVYGAVENDEGMNFFERHLQGSGPDKRGNCFSPDYAHYLHESYRVLKPGGMRCSMDYPTYFSESDNEFCEKQSRKAVTEPYIFDLTHYIDMELQKKIALQAGFARADFGDLMKAIGDRFDICLTDAIGRDLLTAVK